MYEEKEQIGQKRREKKSHTSCLKICLITPLSQRTFLTHFILKLHPPTKACFFSFNGEFELQFPNKPSQMPVLARHLNLNMNLQHNCLGLENCLLFTQVCHKKGCLFVCFHRSASKVH